MANKNPNLLRPVPVPRPDEVLAERYEQLRAWALGFTRGDKNVALDIVHDLYLYVSLAKPDFSRVENLDNYLYKCLRHLHLAYLAEASRSASHQIAVSDIDSLHFAFWASSESYVLEHQNELRRICHYVVARKDRTRGASLFILRFFHDYHLQEIGEIANLSLALAQPNLSRMRSEVQHYLEEAGRAQSTKTVREENQWTAVSFVELFRELRSTIMAARTGECLEAGELLAHYRTLIPKPIPCALLSHIVSCERCLSIVDRNFRRPTLRDREPLDGVATAGRRRVRKAGVNMMSLGHKELWQIVLRHGGDVFEHRPRVLSIATDGKIIASHNVQGQRSVQSARIERPEQVGCIEVFSDQDVRLALVVLESLPPQGPVTRTEHIDLSDGRWIEMRLIFDSLGLNSEVVYFDPALPMQVNEAARDDDAEAASLRIVPLRQSEEYAVEVVPSEPNSEDAELVPKRWRLRGQRQAAGWSRLWSRVKRMSFPDMNPLLTGAMILAVASVVLFLAWMNNQPRITPSAILNRAEKSEGEVSRNAQPGVIYQKVRIATGKRTLERTIYRDAQGIRSPRRRQLSPDDEKLKGALTSAGVNWDAPLSAVDYGEWRQRSGATRDKVMRSGQNLLTITTAPDGTGPVVKETMTVRDTDFHPVDRTVELRDSGTIEIAELNYEMLPWSAVNQDWFEPLAGTATDVPGILPSVAVHVPHVLSDLELDEAELGARVALNQLQADTGEQIHLARQADGVHVKGIVETDVRKQELVSRLSQIPHVQTVILSVEELGNTPQPRTPAESSQPIRVYSVEARVSPLEQYLRERQLPLDQLTSISHSLLDGGLRIQQAEVHFAELRQHFQAANQLPVDAQNQVTILSRNYVDTIEAALDTNQRTLRSLGLENTGEAEGPPDSNFPGEDIGQQIRQYQQLCQALITSGAGQSRSALAIANELIDQGERIRRLVQTSAAVSRGHN